MEKGQTFMIENFFNNWNAEFPQYTLNSDELKKPHALMEALFQVFNKLGIDNAAVLAPPQEENESTSYYWDLLPVINMTRVVNYIVAVMPQFEGFISIMHFLQPNATTSRSIILLPFNLLIFNQERLNAIAPNEEALFAKTDHVKTLESRKNKLIVMLNHGAEEKAKLAQRNEQLGPDNIQFEEELKQESEVHNEEKKQYLEPIQNKNNQIGLLTEQKKSQRDAILAELARRKTLRVYDADDIKAQAEQAAQNDQEVEEKLNTLRTTLMQKENSLKNLQTTKPNLDTANNLLHEIMKLNDNLKEFETGDLDSDSKEGELDVLKTELSELKVQFSELQVTRAEVADKRQESQAKREKEKSQVISALRESVEKDEKCRSRCKTATLRIDDIKDHELIFRKEKTDGFEELAAIKSSFCHELEAVQSSLIKKTIEVEKRVKERLRNRNL